MIKIKNNRNSSFFLIILVAGVFLTLLYYSYLSYLNYKEKRHTLEHISLIEKVDNILSNIDKERTCSAIYMGTNHKSDLEELEKYRNLVNVGLEEIFGLLQRERHPLLDKLRLRDISGSLIYTRSLVNVFSIDYQHILFENYATKIVKPFVDIVKYLRKISSISDDYFQLLVEQENLYSEKSFVTFMLSGQKVMNHQDLLKWEYLIENDTLINVDLEILTTLRGEIFLNSSIGMYTVPLKRWIEVNTHKNNIIQERKNSILSEMKKSINSELSALTYQMFKYLLASLALFIILIILSFLYRKSLQNNRLLIDTLSDLESDLNVHQREEIKKVLKKNDTIAIYRFLVNAIKEPSRAKDHFLANMSHEIRTPLNGIIGFTNILKETELKEDQQEFLAIIEESSNNLISIVNDILDFSKVASGKVEIENIAFNVMEKFEASIDSYAAKAAQKNIDLHLLIDPTLPVELMGDATKISQVIINLLSNAVKFTEEGGRVDIKIEQVTVIDNHVRLRFSIKDSGIGMSLKEQEKVFDAFSQADASTSRKFGGTGLGLSISKKFVSLMGGELALTSTEGKGTTFYFFLDLEKSPTSIEKEIPDLSDINALYVTLVEEDKINKNLQTYISYTGAKFETIDYKSLLTMGGSQLPDIIFIDHQYINNEKIITSLCELDTKSILISTAEIEKCNCEIKDKISKILYKPINFSKTLRSLNIVKREKVLREENHSKGEVAELKAIKTTRVFKNVSALVVEDNFINQKLLSSILGNFDINVTLANNGLEALTLSKKNQYDIIFMDIQMPIMDGVESTQKIIEFEQENNLIHVPIVALTANILDSDRKRYLEIGMDRYLRKPVDVSHLMAIIEEYFPIKEIRDSIYLDNCGKKSKGQSDKLILYKETSLTGKIYTAVLNNLGYSVDFYGSTDEFLEHLDKDNYKFALFDAKLFTNINSEHIVVDLIRKSGATPIAFVDKKGENSYCETLDSIGHANEISEKLATAHRNAEKRGL
jgi:signal transduction histidine kinase/CheY-like chemotaxis protein